MVSSLSHSFQTSQARARHAESSSGQPKLEHAIDAARMALEDRYLALHGAVDPPQIDELQRVRTRLHKLAEIHGGGHTGTRDAALQAWLRGA